MPDTSASSTLLSDVSKDWRRLRTQKHRLRGGVEARIITSLGFWYGEQYLAQAQGTMLTRPLGDADKNKLYLVFNMIRKLTKRKIGRLWSVAPEFSASPNHTDPTAFDQADVVNDLIRGLDHKLSERMLQWKRLWWLVVAGTVIEHTPWIEDVTDEPLPAFDPDSGELIWRDQQTNTQITQSQVEKLVQMGMPPERFDVVENIQTLGDVGSEIIDPLRFFIDASVLGINKLGPKQRCYIAEIKTVDWIRENFGNDAAIAIQKSGNDLSIVQTRLMDRGPSVANMNLRDMMPAIQGTRASDDPAMAIVLTGYEPQCKEYPHGRRVIFCPDQTVLDDGDNDYGEVPCTDFHFEPPTTTFWTGDFITDMIPGQKFLNKRMSQLGESANAGIYEVLLLGSELSAGDIPSDLPGVIEDGLDDNGQPRVQPLQRGQLPSFFLESIKLITEYLDSVGSSDLIANRQFPGQLRGPLAIPMLQELLDSEDGPFYDHLGEQLARVKQLRVNRVKQFYPPLRTMHFTGKGRKDEVLVFHTEAILRAGTDFAITVDRGSLVPEISALRQARVREDLESPISIIYTNKRTGRIDPTKIARALRYNDRDELDRETQDRKLAQHIIKQLWSGTPLSPNIPRPFWDHNAMMDELEAAMITTEFEEASEQIQAGFLGLYDKHRQFLDSIQSAQAQAVQSQQMKSAIAQATQQTAAQVAAETVHESLAQIRASVQASQAMPPGQRVDAEMAQNRANPQGQPQSRLAPNAGRPQPQQGIQSLMGRG